jgi:uncharacterized protein YkwD
MKIGNLLSALSLVLTLTGCYRTKNSTPKKSEPSNSATVKTIKTEYSKDDIFVVTSYIKSFKDYNFSKKYINLSRYLKYIQDRINYIRAKGTHCSKRTRVKVKNDKYLNLAASYHAMDMAMNDFISHDGSGTKTDVARERDGKGSKFYERIIFFGYPIKPKKRTGEIVTYTKFNIVGTTDIVAHFNHALDNFIKSPKHCQVLTDRKFRYFGVGAYRSSDRIYWVIDFAER